MSKNSTNVVAKNSAWLILQPLILNIVSLFVIGVVARELGPDDYGLFLFAIAYGFIFRPLTNLGLRASTVRNIAQDRQNAAVYLGQTVVLRALLGVAVLFVVAVSLVLLDYDQRTIYLVSVASSMLFFQALASAFHDNFQAFEQTKYVATSQLYPGLAVSAITLSIMYLGFGLDTLIWVYVGGSLATLLVCWQIQRKHFFLPKPSFSLPSTAQQLREGFPFLVPQLLNTFNSRFGIILLSKVGGNVPVSMYGSATNLTDRLMVVPEGLGAALFPTISTLANTDREAALVVFRNLARYVLLIGLPMAAGLSAISEDVIQLIYGSQYLDSIPILVILSWSTFFLFLISVYGWTANAFGFEKQGAKISVYTTPFFLLLCLILAHRNGALGVAMAVLINSAATFFILRLLVKKYVTSNVFSASLLFRAFLATALMVGALLLTANQPIFVKLPVGALIYLAGVWLLGAITTDEKNDILEFIRLRAQV